MSKEIGAMIVIQKRKNIIFTIFHLHKNQVVKNALFKNLILNTYLIICP